MDTVAPAQETQQRARSKTPFTLRSSCDRDVCANLGPDHVHDKKKSPVKKNPTVEPIAEEKDAVVANAGQRATRTKKTIAKIITSDYSSDDTEHAKNGQDVKLIEQISASVTKSSTIITTTKTVKSSSEQKQKELSNEKITKSQSTKTTRSANKESTQNDSNNLFEQNAKLKTSTPRAVKNSVTETTNGNGVNLDDHVAFKEYKESGEYWNRFPKTDYTYSPYSKNVREVRPGVIAMPNMSRRSLDHHSERVAQMAARDPAKESYFRSRYLSMTSSIRNRSERAADNFYDSQDESDLSQFGRNDSRLSSFYTTTRVTSTTIMRRIISVFTTILSVIVSPVTYVIRRNKERAHISAYQRVQTEQGIIGKWVNSTWSTIVAIFQYIYLGISSILLFDTWLLKSKETGNHKKRWFILLLLVCLPLLLLGVWQRSVDLDGNTIHKASVITLPSISAYSKGVGGALTSHFGWVTNLFSRDNTLPNNPDLSVSDENYQKILSHVNEYITSLLSEKVEQRKIEMEEERVSHKLALHIATIVKEHTQNIINYRYVLTDEDCDRIAQQVLVAMRKESAGKEEYAVLSKQNIDLIIDIVNQQIQMSGTKDVEQTDQGKAMNIDEITHRILTSPKLESLFNDKIEQSSDELLDRIKYLNEHVLKLQTQINAISVEHKDNIQDVKLSLDNLRGNYDSLTQVVDRSVADNSANMKALAGDIEKKLQAISEGQNIAIDQQTKTLISRILGYHSEDNAEITENDLSKWIQSVFVAKKLLEQRLLDLETQLKQDISQESNQNTIILMDNISKSIEREFLNMLERRKGSSLDAEHTHENILDEQLIWRIVKKALETYDADKTGMVDYALESAGGEVLSTRCTENFYTQSAQISVFGIPLWYKTNTPRTVISPSVHPGDCWAFQGFPGYLVLRLNSNIYVSGFTIEHIPKSIAINGKIDSAPKSFTVLGLLHVNDQEPFQYGDYEFAENGTSLQYFPVKNPEKNTRPYNMIEVRIDSNHGHPNYTCVYRFRVHGTLESADFNLDSS